MHIFCHPLASKQLSWAQMLQILGMCPFRSRQLTLLCTQAMATIKTCRACCNLTYQTIGAYCSSLKRCRAMPPRALPSSKPKTAAEKWKAWLNSEYKDEQKFAANLVCIES